MWGVIRGVRDRGYYSGFGGCFVPEVLVQTFEELVEAFDSAKRDPELWPEYERLV